MSFLPVVLTDQDSVSAEIFVAAPSERVFQALVNREQALQWGNNSRFEITEWEMDARPGGKWRFVSLERSARGEIDPAPFEHHGEILEFKPPRLLVYSWFANWHSDLAHQTTVKWELSPVTGGTRVRLAHSGLASLVGACEGYAQGWPGLLLGIKNFLESQSDRGIQNLKTKSS
jgi:uncharacterized protein YndB with AHSA1/START domain